MYLDRKYRYKRTLPHLMDGTRPLFVTFRTFKQWELPPAARQIVLEHCLREDAKSIDIHIVVVMPTHVHLLFSPRRDVEGWIISLPKVTRLIKGRSAHFINKLLHRHGVVWQEECFDHVLRSDESLTDKIDYISNNPVRAGLVRRAEDYPWLWRRKLPVL